jgi:hypothetical protein
VGPYGRLSSQIWEPLGIVLLHEGHGGGIDDSSEGAGGSLV